MGTLPWQGKPVVWCTLNHKTWGPIRDAEAQAVCWRRGVWMCLPGTQDQPPTSLCQRGGTAASTSGACVLRPHLKQS